MLLGNDWTSNFSCWLIIPVSPFVQEGVHKFFYGTYIVTFFGGGFFQVYFLNFAGRKLRGKGSNLRIFSFISKGWRLPTN